MPAIFLHGVPDTSRVWDDVLRELGGSEKIALSLPGFSSPLPTGFTCSKEDYVEWIIERLEEIGRPVDLVGHDWGCILVLRVASLRPDLVRTWAAGGGPVDHDYGWHPLAKIWQTPGKGEEFMAALDRDQLEEQLRKLSVPPAAARTAAAQFDDQMKDSILRLYRSAVNVGAEWEPDLSQISSPGAVLWGRHDHDCPERFGDRLALHTRACSVTKLDTGHWFLLEQPRVVADVLRHHWLQAADES